MTKQALIVVRLSRLVDESTSAQRQKEECEKLCERMGWEVAGVAEDLNVSAGSTSPFERPELGKWLGDGKDSPGRAPEIDIIVFWRVDRLVRSMTQLWEVMIWADKHNIALKSATESHFDTSTSYGKMVASLVASFAQVELEAIRERTAADQRYRIQSGKYRGALPSWGYMPYYDEVKGWVVVPEQDQVRQVNLVAQKILDGQSLQSIAAELNEAGELTPRDRHDVRMGREPRGRQWTGGRLKAMITSKAMLGYAMVRDPVLDKDGKPVRKNGKKVYSDIPRVAIDNEGNPVKRAEAILDRDTWKRVVKTVQERALVVSKRSHSLLLNVIYCGVCGGNAYKMTPNNGRKPTYRCSSMQAGRTRCCDKTLQVNAAYVENALEGIFLQTFGDSLKTVRVWDPGEDHSDEVKELEGQIDDLVSVLATHKPGSRVRTAIESNLERIDARLQELNKLGTRAPGWKWSPTEETVTQWWERSSVQERNKYLIEQGIKVTFEHEEVRQRNAVPHLEIEFPNFYAMAEELQLKGTAKKVKKVMDELPESYHLHLGNK